ncbi:hypothetical protein PF005_g15793 [Phytophthora fragariae]|uniref:Uncharacterized protein n=2 Tax=Phytophthora TaxID=4783 RepID=A0A6A3RQW5_9STRA|nr:hypothetical protein PF003_g24861 [Phytophthora fragariae]KAE9001383.1 hypothetical protein PR002_g17926 [Phytophthora rubi]KAE8932846.1 hypothetical protein PF009_g17136 [Phytophthora fragariae]KAE8998841.1 hypothetical protein PF011_g14876 [Phytophthora fragariae]KAE9098709.1 hypothetical protein PF007_g16158 [Phytophthora fragariae]
MPVSGDARSEGERRPATTSGRAAGKLQLLQMKLFHRMPPVYYGHCARK